MKASIGKLGEFGLIDLIKQRIFSEDKQVLVNIGDDTAVLRLSSDKLLIFTTDTMVEKIHFDLSYFTFEEMGWKAMAANLSDIAAMGGSPTYGLVTIGLPKSMLAREVLSIYKGASHIAGKYGCRIIGGDTTLVPKHLFVSVALLGEADRKSLITRSGAKRGDLICVTGNLGEAQAGLEFLKAHGRKNLSLVRKHLKPQPRISESRVLIRRLRVNSMIDVSDGLSSDLFHLTEESRLGALIHEEHIPVSSKCLKLASLLKRSPVSWALSSGEEYELLFTVDRRDRNRIEKVKREVDITVVGEMVDREQGVRLATRSGRRRKLAKTGFAHF
jgi:thiamine-monophosphate kinase